ncbi:MAG: HyaD/HybD family hydrogenase maturation endopeptidase [Gemmatimonadota bacterium]|nr:HyaD/HybD family hydrogenase maturation endopeptidase [Gemmatimonadota bacterium]
MPGRESSGPSSSTLLIGVGSPLMGDDGLGLRALETIRGMFRFEPHVELLDGGTWGMNLLPFLEGADRALLLDAIDAAEAPGTLVELEGEALPRFLSTKLSPHQIDLREVLALAELRGTLPEVVVLGLQPGRVELEAKVGSEVEAALPRLVEAAVRRLAAWGHDPVPAAAAAGG